MFNNFLREKTATHGCSASSMRFSTSHNHTTKIREHESLILGSVNYMFLLRLSWSYWSIFKDYWMQFRAGERNRSFEILCLKQRGKKKKNVERDFFFKHFRRHKIKKTTELNANNTFTHTMHTQMHIHEYTFKHTHENTQTHIRAYTHRHTYR